MKPAWPDQKVAPAPAPAACPFCGSPKIKTTSVQTDASAYWRCEACGQMWNVGRLGPSHRQGHGGRWA